MYIGCDINEMRMLEDASQELLRVDIFTPADSLIVIFFSFFTQQCDLVILVHFYAKGQCSPPGINFFVKIGKLQVPYFYEFATGCDETSQSY